MGQELTPLWMPLGQFVGNPWGSRELESLRGRETGSYVLAWAVLHVRLEGVLLCGLVRRCGGWGESCPGKRKNI